MAKKLLYVVCNPKQDSNASRSQQIAEAYIDAFKEVQPDLIVDKINLFHAGEDLVPEIDEDLIFARAGLSFRGLKFEDLSPEQQRKYKNHVACCDHFIDHDFYVFASPIWNLGSPHYMKKYIDNLFANGKTFIAKPDERRGLLTGHVQHIQTRGGTYSTGPLVEFESGDRYLKIAMEFMGLTYQPVIYAEGLDHNPRQAPEIVAAAKEQARKAAIELATSTKGE
ncbi:MAG: hypothetical protein K0R71_1974 [Bacillales bacterium]|jgi:FMN-dependent NADH-azoreductase|nr:hypothetical protein [Bacillales bacterium]